MTGNSKAKIREILYQHYEFADCILESVSWRNNGIDLELRFNYVWSDADGFNLDQRGAAKTKSGTMRADLEKVLLKIMKCRLVQELRICNYLNDAQLKSPEEVGWGFSVVDRFEVLDDSLFLAPYRHHVRQFHHLVCRLPSDRRVDIVCSDIEVS